MGYLFTAGAERALDAAARWSRNGLGSILPIMPVEMLLGLLHESECRAAKLLAEHGVDEAAVRERWPELHRDESPEPPTAATRGPSFDVEESLRRACERLDEPARSFQFATEHILLGLVTAPDDVGEWLRERGVDAEAIEREWARVFGNEIGPIDVDLEPIPLVEEVSNTQIVYEDGDVAPSNEALEKVDTQQPRMYIRGYSRDKSDVATMRIVDAAANRTGEALRVVEDYVRFVRNDAELMRLCKELRHELTSTLAAVPMSERLAARDTVHDVGTNVSTSAEMTRLDPADVAGANVRRLQESLRSLEEFAKLIDPMIASRCEALRYRSYTLHRLIGGQGPQRPGIDAARLYVLLDGRADAASFEALVRSLVAAGVDVLQLRDKKLDDRALLDRARRLREITRGTRTLFVMNDRADLAAVAEADGVHVGQEELTVAEARQIVGLNRLVGVSTHTLEQARQAMRDGADYIGVGPVFPSATKTFEHFPGLELVAAVASEIRLPAFAIGGMTAENVVEVRNAGLSRVAVGAAVVDAADPGAAARSLLAQL